MPKPRQTYGNLTADARHTLITKGWKPSGVIMRYAGKAKNIRAVKRSLWRSGYTVKTMFYEELKWYWNYLTYHGKDYILKRGRKIKGALGRLVFDRQTETEFELRGHIWCYCSEEKNKEDQNRLRRLMDTIWYTLSDMSNWADLIVVDEDFRVVDKETIAGSIAYGAKMKRVCYFEILRDGDTESYFSEMDMEEYV